MELRPYQPRDLPALYRICLATANAGLDASAFYRDPLLVGHVYAAPYALFVPRCCFVAEDRDGVGGYIVGALHTAAFEERLEFEWWHLLRQTYPDPSPVAEHGWRFDRLMMRLIHHPVRTPQRIVEAFPSHLHINLLPRLQGHGHGKRLIDAWLNGMQEMGSCGAHLAVGTANTRALEFYRRFGFAEIERTGREKNTVWFGTTLRKPVGVL